jgi:disulfide bond formation protein DsbB
LRKANIRPMTLAASKDQALTLSPESMAALLAGGMSAALLLGALTSQYLGGLAPCEMCIWQRWPHGAAIVFGLFGGGLVMGRMLPPNLARPLAILAIVSIAISGAIGVFHAGVEWKLWPGPPECTGFGYVPGRDDFKPLQIVRCDEAQWRLFGISLAGYNALISLAAAALAISVLRRGRV